MEEKILTEITNFCKGCSSCECCPEGKCVLFGIEQLIILQQEENKKEGQ